MCNYDRNPSRDDCYGIYCEIRKHVKREQATASVPKRKVSKTISINSQTIVVCFVVDARKIMAFCAESSLLALKLSRGVCRLSSHFHFNFVRDMTGINK
jgi:hypothetical protein